MAIVTKLPPEEREVPHEPGNYMSFRPLSGGEMADARAAVVREMVERFGPDVSRLFMEIERRDTERAGDRDDEMSIEGYSTASLLRGVAEWRGDQYAEPVSPQNIAGLDSKTRIWAARQVLDLSRIASGEETSSEPGTDRTNGSMASESREPSNVSG